MTKQTTQHKNEQKKSQGLSSQFIEKMAAELQAVQADRRQLR
jgi:hypothetical protein